MRFHKISFTVFWVTGLFFPAIQLQQPPATRATIRVEDPVLPRIPGARIRIDAAAAEVLSKMEQNERGEFSLPLEPDRYELPPALEGLESSSSRLEVAYSKTTQMIPVILEIGAGSAAFVEPVPATANLRVLIVATQKQSLLSSADLKLLPHIAVTVQNAHNNTQERYSGVRVADLFAKLSAPLGGDLRGKAMLNYVRATGSDNYQVVFSLAELDPAFHSGEIIVADQLNDQPLDDKSGPFKLVATEDKRPARWVRNLVTLELLSAE